MLVEHTLTPDDVVAFSRYHTARARQASKSTGAHTLITLLIAGGFAILLVMDTVQQGNVGILYILLSLMGLGIIVWLLQRRAVPGGEGRLRRMFMSKEGQKALGQRRLTLTPQHLVLDTEEGSDTLYWDQISDVGVTHDHAFLYLENEAVLIIPARAFSNDWQFEEFLTKVRDCRNAVGAPA